MNFKNSKLTVDVFGMSVGSIGWVTHAVNFAVALRPLASVRFRTARREVLRGMGGGLRAALIAGLWKGPGDFGVVISGQPFRRERSARWIVWETTELPAAQRELCETVEYLWTPSKWGRENLISNGIDQARIAVVPEGVDTKFFTPKPKSQGRFRFLMVGKWEERKFQVGLLNAFNQEFNSNEPVELFLHANNPYIPGFSLRDTVRESGVPDNGNVILGEGPCAIGSLRELYRSADCFVLPTRSEGWGLPILESMACGVPAIVTAYSAPTDYVTEENGYPLDVERMVEAHDDHFSIHGGMWAEPSVPHLRHLMRQAYENRGELAEKGRIARITAERFSWDNSASFALDTIKKSLESC